MDINKSRKIVGKMGILLNVIFIGVFVFWGNPLNIPKLKIHISYITLVQLFYLGMFCWYKLPLMKMACTCGGIIELLYHLVPAFVLCLFIFGQYYIYSFGVIFGLIISFLIFWQHECFRIFGYNKKIEKKKDRKRIKAKCRLCVIVITIACVGPVGFVLANAFRSPQFTGESLVDIPPEYLDENYEIDLIMESNKDILTNFQDKKWKKLSEQEKINMLKTVADIECMYLGVKSVNVISETMPLSTRGSWNDTNSIIAINRYNLENSNPDEIVRTVLHEVFHVFQSEVCKLIYVDSKKDKSNQIHSLYYGDIRSWITDDKNYTSSFEDGYYTQSLEVSARKYAEENMERYKKYIYEE